MLNNSENHIALKLQGKDRNQIKSFESFFYLSKVKKNSSNSKILKINYISDFPDGFQSVCNQQLHISLVSCNLTAILHQKHTTEKWNFSNLAQIWYTWLFLKMMRNIFFNSAWRMPCIELRCSKKYCFHQSCLLQNSINFQPPHQFSISWDQHKCGFLLKILLFAFGAQIQMNSNCFCFFAFYMVSRILSDYLFTFCF